VERVIAHDRFASSSILRLDFGGQEELAMYLDGSREEIITWVREGLSDRVIAERARVSPSTVRYWRQRNGIVRPPREAPPPLRPSTTPDEMA